MICVKFKSLRISTVDVSVNVTVSTSWKPLSVRKKGISIKDEVTLKVGVSIKEELSLKEGV